MHSPFRKRGVILAGLLALALAAALPSVAAAKPEPGFKKTRGFRLMAGALGAMTINRIYCGLSNVGQVCVDSTNSSTIGGGFWPRGTSNQYIFNSGLQIAGIISPVDGGPWAGDTTGAFFFNARGGENSEGVTDIYNTASSTDLETMPSAGYVPIGDTSADLFNPLLQVDSTQADLRRRAASQADVWWMSWDGNPQLNVGRPHPLGIVVETRGMGWNFPTGNEDILYFIYTFYNITTTNPAAYVGIRDSMVDILVAQATDFQAKNNAAFGVTLPPNGYTMTELYAAFGTDMDVAQAGTNYSSVNLPFALGYTYEDVFTGEASWTFDANTYAPPFFAGAGFSGIKYLKSPDGPGAIQLFSNTVNGSPFAGAFNDPASTTQLWRYLSGNISVPAGDQACNNGNPAVTRICWINNTQPVDMRFFQSSTGLTLAPGESKSIVVAYIFAPPVAVGACATAPCTSVKPGNPTILGDPGNMTLGVNQVDSMTGFLGFNDLDGDNEVEQEGDFGAEWTVVAGSLLGKSYTAQAVFDSKFLLPFAPVAPNFFLIPGDNNVTIFWQPTPSEIGGDPYYSIAQDPSTLLYNPNYRQFDVEGYRIYRGRVDNPDGLSLVAQFDYSGTVFNDYDGVVNPVVTCAPELNIYVDCPVPYSPVIPGVARTVSNSNNIVSPFLQTKFNGRLALADGLAWTIDMDTASTGNASGLPPLSNTGVPFVYNDNTVRNNFRYFYVVTAFDINSYSSGPSSLESPKAGTIAVVPQAPASNYANSTTFSSGIYGRDVLLNSGGPLPTINATTGKFSGPMPASNAWTIGFEDFVQEVIAEPGNFSVRLDSILLGSSYQNAPITYYLSAINGPSVVPLTASLVQGQTNGPATAAAAFPAVRIDGQLAAVYGGTDDYFLNGQASFTLVGTYYTGLWGRGCVNGAAGFGDGTTCSYNGPRWFAGPSPANNETMDNPNSGNQKNFTTNTVNTAAPNSSGWNNAGELPGVAVITNYQAYNTYQNTWRQINGIGSGAYRAADYNVYWNAGGLVDSVIDITHNVPVPANDTLYRGGWGFLNQSGSNTATSYDLRAAVLTIADIGCVEPYRTYSAAQGLIPCTGARYNLSQTAVPGVTAFSTTSLSNATWGPRFAPAAANPGFIMFIGGEIFQFMLADAGGTLPAAGTVWALRTYTGAIQGGTGTGGSEGPYSFTTVQRPFTAVGTDIRVNYDVINQVNATSNSDLTKIHTVPDPYYVTNEYEVDFTSKVIKFVNLPTEAIIRIYSSSGVLVRVLNYSAPEFGGMLDWNVRNRNNQVVASGVYFYHVESGDARFIGRMTIVNFAQ